MLGLMMDKPLLINEFLEFAARYHGDQEIVSHRVEGDVHRYTYRDALRRSKQCANMLQTLGIKSGDVVGTLAWNTYRHLELYYGISGMGSVCHTINPRLFEEQLVYIINHAKDRVIFFDTTFAAQVDKLKAQCPAVEHWISLSDEAQIPAETPYALSYEVLMAKASGEYEWPIFDENTASSMCYTSGTTGNPKGVLYSHRSTVLHAYAFCLPDACNLSCRDVVMPVVPMFHANAWSFPYCAPLVGAKMVLPGARLDPASLSRLMVDESVNLMAGVPTIWSMLLQYLEQTGTKLPTLTRTLVGGSAPPASMIEACERMGAKVTQAWGMTETSPVATVSGLKRKHADIDFDGLVALKSKQGCPVFGVDVEIMDASGQALPHDGVAFGDLMVKGPWIASGYFGVPDSPLIDGWFPTGDVATMDPDGYVQIVDRSKDVIKSGGEWISSVELENLVTHLPGVALAIAIGIRHPKWEERPLLIIQPKEGVKVSKEEVFDFLKGKVAKWWIPEDVVFTDDVPLTATGKLYKMKLRERYRDHYMTQPHA